jgi:hypothetical protein
MKALDSRYWQRSLNINPKKIKRVLSRFNAFRDNADMKRIGREAISSE